MAFFVFPVEFCLVWQVEWVDSRDYDTAGTPGMVYRRCACAFHRGVIMVIICARLRDLAALLIRNSSCQLIHACSVFLRGNEEQEREERQRLIPSPNEWQALGTAPPQGDSTSKWLPILTKLLPLISLVFHAQETTQFKKLDLSVLNAH